VAKIHAKGREIFTTDEAFRHWIKSPAIVLDGQAPLDLLDTGIGTREVESLLHGISHGHVM
tara:strand:- start:697 stop:879 length:183 start_codon:yes stop_codon:yes gene_type:complete